MLRGNLSLTTDTYTDRKGPFIGDSAIVEIKRGHQVELTIVGTPEQLARLGREITAHAEAMMVRSETKMAAAG